MNILFDCVTPQTLFGGGGNEYIRCIFNSLLDYKKRGEVNLFAAIDSSLQESKYMEFSYSSLKEACTGVVDIKGRKLSKLVSLHKIDKVFVGVAQVWASRYSFADVNCEVITVIHDVHDEELESVRLYSYLSLFGSLAAQIRQCGARILRCLRSSSVKNSPLSVMINYLIHNERWKCITVSQYSKFSIVANFSVPEDKVLVFSSPERFFESVTLPSDSQLANLLNERGKYYLVVSAGRPEKNAMRAIKAFDKYRNRYLVGKGNKELPKIVTLGLDTHPLCDGHISLPMLAESDLVHVYKNAYALLYPSFFEGFGYPPVEAMKFGIPVLASNVTSIPEILGDAPIYFSPFYVSDIFRALCLLNDSNRNEYIEKSRRRYDAIHNKQVDDLKEIIKLITR